ncbi:hypothetical protein B0O99DRAFT_690460 [Bisporella sp. PMI_857]|nr:hypothetical protein B0O99DRAFT_690460 [Bisporella sp. PMI_857]
MVRIGIRLFKKKKVQKSAQASFAASAVGPDSGFAFVNNSQGASAALNELTIAFSTALDYIESGDDFDDHPLRTQLKVLEDAVGEYSNSASDCSEGISDWNGSKSTIMAIAAAFKCSASVYKSQPTEAVAHDSDDRTSVYKGTHRKPQMDGITFTELEYAGPSLGGTSKAINFWIAESESSAVSSYNLLPALVIAIRGTEKPIDNMVNINGRPAPVSGFLNLNSHPVLQSIAAGISAHSGFLNSARALLPLVSKHLSKMSHRGVMNVIYTGHSAGGAVASLLYQKFLLEAPSSYPNLKFSCITFGSPPTLTVNITKTLSTAASLEANRGLSVAFVNEFDVIPRADQAYVRSLIDLYRSIYKLEPLMSDTIMRDQQVAEPIIKYELPPLDFGNSDSDSDCGADFKASSPDSEWKLPLAEYHIIGELVLLRNKRNASTEMGPRTSRVLQALSISAREYEKLLYCGIQTHSRTYYEDRVGLLLKGEFNYKKQWED